MSKPPKSKRNKKSGLAPLEMVNTRKGKPKSLTGFMLLEVMLSVFIVVVGVVFVTSSFVAAIKAFKISRAYLDALYLMEDKMWEYEESGSIEEGSDSGDFEGYKNAEWNVNAEEIEGLPLNETTVEVALKKEDKARRLSIVTYLLQKEGL